MARTATQSIRLRIIYDGATPNTWDGGPGDFGLQDKSGTLHPGKFDPKSSMIFDLTLDVNPEAGDTPVFLGQFAHGPPKERFLYLSWRRPDGGFSQRIKLLLSSLTWSDVSAALTTGKPIVGEASGRMPATKPKPGATNIGGAREVAWRPPKS